MSKNMEVKTKEKEQLWRAGVGLLGWCLQSPTQNWKGFGSPFHDRLSREEAGTYQSHRIVGWLQRYVYFHFDMVAFTSVKLSKLSLVYF